MKVQHPIFKTSAIFWDGKKQLEGVLELWDAEIIFHFEDYKNSSLNLVILISEIENVQLFMIYRIARNGVKIISKRNRIDQFVLEDSKYFFKLLLQQLSLV